MASVGLQSERGRRAQYISDHPTLGRRYAIVQWEDDKPLIGETILKANLREVKPKPTEGNIATATDEFLDEARASGQVHGSALRDAFALHGVIGSLWDMDDSIIRGLVSNDTLEPIAFAPNTSQAAFTGLQYNKSYIREVATLKLGVPAGLANRFIFKFNTGEE